MTRNPRTLLIIAFAGLSAALASCTVGPDYHRPEIAVPASWAESAPDAAADAASPHVGWWDAFNDPTLSSLINRAVRANTDVRVAMARVLESRAFRGVTSGALFPQVDVAASYTNSRLSENGFVKGLGEGQVEPGPIAPGEQINLYQLGLEASWEIDVFGGRRRAVEGADADIQAAEFDLRDVLVAVMGDVAEEYITLRSLQERLAIAQRTAESERDSARIVAEQAKSGVASDLDAARASSQAASAAARIPELEAQVHRSLRRLEKLLGEMPGALDDELLAAAPLPAPPESINTGIPSDVLRRRPDIRAAERRLAAATARVGVATAELFPRFSLTGSFGLQSQELGELPYGDSRFWAIGPSVRWPILDFGRLRSNIDVQNARTMAAEAQYEGAVIDALSDVEGALVQLSRQQRRQADLAAAAQDARQAADIAQELYGSGLLEYLDLLDTQRSLYQTEDALAQNKAAIALATVRLYRSLGGGWEAVAGPVSPPAPDPPAAGARAAVSSASN